MDIAHKKRWPAGRVGKKGFERIGKTERDHKEGTQQRNVQNKALRAEWNNDNRAKADGFPGYTAHGKGNSSKAKKY